jgi:tRNA(fMet)-specific endonuclease VapC
VERGEVLKALLDSTVLIDLLKGEKTAIDTIEKLRKNATLYTTTVNIYEVLRGIHVFHKDKEKHLQAFRVLTSNIYILGLDLESSEKAALIYAELRTKGLEIDASDYLIAGIALTNGISTVVTRNEKHFNEIKELNVISY